MNKPNAAQQTAVTPRPARKISGEHPVVRPPSDDGNAFLPDPRDYSGALASTGDLAETLAEGFLTSATSGEDHAEDMRDAITAEELGGPFIVADADEEFAAGVDEANPEDAEAEPFPTAIGGHD